MAKTVVYQSADTAISGVSSLSVPIGLVNYGKDWAIRAGAPANELRITNLNSPRGLEEQFRFAQSDIANVYRNTKIDPGLYSPSKRGVSILSQLTGAYTVTDTVTSEVYAAPIKGHIVLSVPSDQNITDAMVLTFVGRMISGLFNTGVVTSERMKAMLRGSLLPKDL